MAQPNRADAIIISPRAAALLRAGLIVRALVLAALEHAYMRLTLGTGRVLVLEGGIYRT